MDRTDLARLDALEIFVTAVATSLCIDQAARNGESPPTPAGHLAQACERLLESRTDLDAPVAAEVGVQLRRLTGRIERFVAALR